MIRLTTQTVVNLTETAYEYLGSRIRRNRQSRTNSGYDRRTFKRRQNILDQLLLMFEKGLNQPIIYWQLASILGSLFLAWLLGKYIRMRIIKHLAANEIIESDEIKAEEGEARSSLNIARAPSGQR